MNKSRITLRCILCILISVIINVSSFAADNASYLKYDSLLHNACGPANLYFALRLLGKNPEFSNIMAQTQRDRDGRSNFQTLQDTARHNGLETLCVHMDTGSLKTLDNNCLAILHFSVNDEPHFVLFAGWTGNKINILDATKTDHSMLTYMEQIEFNTSWTGNALLLSNQPIVLAPGRSAFVIGVGSIFGLCIFMSICIMSNVNKLFKQNRRRRQNVKLALF